MTVMSSWKRGAAVAVAVALGVFVASSPGSPISAQQPGAAPGQGPGAGPGGGAPGAGRQAAPGGRQGRGGRGGGRGAPVDTLPEGPWTISAGRGGRARVSVLTRGVDSPWGIAFPSPDTILLTERPGRLRVIRNGTLDPAPISGLPEIVATNLGGLLDVALHPDFAQNRLVYFTYSKPGENGSSTTALGRGRWDGGGALTEVKDVFVAPDYHGGAGTQMARGVGNAGQIGPADGSYGSRIAFDSQGFLYMTLGDRNFPPKSQDPGTHIGKILRLRDDGTAPPDNPFVGRDGYLPEIYTLGHRNPLGLSFHPETGELWSTEQGPQGGDEMNKIIAGRNYGWPEVSLGRNYDGTVVGKGFTAPGYDEPVVFWVPAIAVSGLSFYNGDAFPGWRGSAFVGALRAGTGRHVQRVAFNAQGLPTGRDLLLTDLGQRIREVKPGPDGNMYVLTDERAGAVLKIEPEPQAQ